MAKITLNNIKSTKVNTDKLDNEAETLALNKGAVICSASKKIKKAKKIVAEIYSLYHHHEDGYKPEGYGNLELNKATDAMYAYIKVIEQS